MTDNTAIKPEADQRAYASLSFSTQAVPTDQSLGHVLFLHDSGVPEELSPKDIYILTTQHDAETSPDFAAFLRWLEGTEALNYSVLTHGASRIGEPTTRAGAFYLRSLGRVLHSETASPHIQRISPLNVDIPFLANATGTLTNSHLMAEETPPEATATTAPDLPTDVQITGAVPITDDEAPQNPQKAVNNKDKSYWINRLMIISSIIAVVGIGLVYVGDYVNTPMVILGGLIIFSAAALCWTVPLVVIPYWLIQDARRFFKRRSAGR